jgi:hypothetical protein
LETNNIKKEFSYSLIENPKLKIDKREGGKRRNK